MSELKAVMLGPQHLGAVDHLHDVQERVLGQKVDRPCPLESPVLLAVGFEDEEGNLKGGFMLEAIAELTFFGVDPDSTDAAVDLAPMIYEFLQSRGIRWLRSFVPKKGELPEQLRDKFQAAGFVSEDHEMCHFAKDLRR